MENDTKQPSKSDLTMAKLKNASIVYNKRVFEMICVPRQGSSSSEVDVAGVDFNKLLYPYKDKKLKIIIEEITDTNEKP